MTNAEKLTLKKHACHIRMGVIEGTHSAGCGHPGGSLSIAGRPHGSAGLFGV